MKKRFFLVVKSCFIALILGLFYAFLCTQGISIPCLFYKITSLKCPGCGITNMCLALLKFDFKGAISNNFAIMTLLPIFAILFLNSIIYYIKTGKLYNSKKQDFIVILIIIYLIAFAIYRNIK